MEQNGALVCLVRGPITERKSSITLGGPGSWYEVRGIDRRIEMSRVCYQKCWEGRASDVVSQIFGLYGFEADVQETSSGLRRIDRHPQSAGHRSGFCEEPGPGNNLCFWITATAEVDLTGSALTVEETAHFTASPPRAGRGNLHRGSGRCADAQHGRGHAGQRGEGKMPERNRLRTSTRMRNSQRAFSGTAIDDRSVEEQTTSAQDNQPPVVDGGESLQSIAPLNARCA